MDMKKLFLDFKKHVEQLDDDAIKQSISRAVEHSINSSSLECEAEKSNGMYVKSSTQLLRQANPTCSFTFSSVNVNNGDALYTINYLGGLAA